MNERVLDFYSFNSVTSLWLTPKKKMTVDITGDDGPTGQLSYSRATPHLGAKL